MKTYLMAFAVIVGLSGSLALAEVTTAPKVDLDLYLGKWFEVASIPMRFQSQCARNTTAEYSKEEPDRIKILNSCDTTDGTRSFAEGRAKVVDPVTNSKLKVTFVKLFGWIFAFGGSYWIIDVDPDYSLALVGDPSAKYAWILSRSPVVEKEQYRKAEEKFRSVGYDTCQILTSIQDGGTPERIPLCDFVK